VASLATATDPSGADAGSAGVGRYGADRNVRPIEIIMACEAGRISIGEWS
jgi:hypothetical protein